MVVFSRAIMSEGNLVCKGFGLHCGPFWKGALLATRLALGYRLREGERSRFTRNGVTCINWTTWKKEEFAT